MPQPLHTADYNYRPRAATLAPVRPQQKPTVKKVVKKKRPKKLNPLKALASLAFLGLTGYFILPYSFTHYFEPMFMNRFMNRGLHFESKQYVSPTLNYVSNSNFQGENLLLKSSAKTPQMTSIVSMGRNVQLEAELKNLAKKYPKIQPSIYVWDYQTAQSAEISPDKAYPSASIIKVPILFEFFKRQEMLKKEYNQNIDLGRKLLLDDLHKTAGSGDLQHIKGDRFLTVNSLANDMITKSDNSATNILLEDIGGMQAMNGSLRDWGFSKTQMSAFLPDLTGTNTITARDVSTMFYNLDNPSFLTENSRFVMKEYLANVHNTTLLKAGLPKNATILHKTGDIGTMLGDSGIVISENGRKYIVSILVKRPHNDPAARDFIKNASALIYKNINTERMY